MKNILKNNSDETVNENVNINNLLDEPIFGLQFRFITKKRIRFVEPEFTIKNYKISGRRLTNIISRRKNIKLTNVLKK